VPWCGAQQKRIQPTLSRWRDSESKLPAYYLKTSTAKFLRKSNYVRAAAITRPTAGVWWNGVFLLLDGDGLDREKLWVGAMQTFSDDTFAAVN
jgi:hypothetical protein